MYCKSEFVEKLDEFAGYFALMGVAAWGCKKLGKGSV